MSHLGPALNHLCRAAEGWSGPDANWDEFTEAKMELGPSLATAAPKPQAGLLSRMFTPSFPTQDSCWPHCPLGNCSWGPVGSQSWLQLWGPLCSHQIP